MNSLVKGIILDQKCVLNKAIDLFLLEKCILCQIDTGFALCGTSNGRKRLRDFASVKVDNVSKRLKQLDDNDQFVYHMTNGCYKQYTHFKSVKNSYESNPCIETTSTLSGYSE
jgi:hypothetical protein